MGAHPVLSIGTIVTAIICVRRLMATIAAGPRKVALKAVLASPRIPPFLPLTGWLSLALDLCIRAYFVPSGSGGRRVAFLSYFAFCHVPFFSP